MEDLPPAPVEEHRFPCARCGSDLRYAPGSAAGDGSGTLLCDHCGNVQAIEVARPLAEARRERDYETAVAGQLGAADVEETRVVTCPSCGARTEFAEGVHAAECPFCATPVVTDTGVHRHIKPHGLLPFALDEAAARKAMSDWLGGLWFAPNGLRDYARKGRRMSGVYVPYWTFDADTQSTYRGERGTHYYVTETYMSDGKRRTRQVQRTRWRPVSGHVARWFDDVLVLASRSLPKRYTDALEPWDLDALLPYQPEFLAGFRAEAYAVPLDEGLAEARQIMDGVIREDARRDIGGDAQRVHSVDTAVRDVTFKHVLLPVWLAAYRYRGKAYRFVVNGRTGRVQGERPWSAWKIAFAVALALLLAGIAALVGNYAS